MWTRRVRPVSVLMVGLTTLAMAAPLLWLLDTAFMGSKAMYSTTLHVFPIPLTLSGFSQLNHLINFGRDFLNSVIVSISQTCGILVVGILAAYSFTRVQWTGRDVVFFIYVAAIAIPGWTLLIPLFLTVRELGWIGTYQGLIIPGMISPIAIFLLRQFMITLPRDLDDAAMVDGASKLRTLISILVPNMYPGILAAGILAFLTTWNNLIWPLLVVNKTSMNTVPLGLSRLAVTGTGWGLNVYWGPLMAGTLLAALPTIALFVLAQKQFIGGLSLAGVRR